MNRLVPLACLAVAMQLPARGDGPVAEAKQKPSPPGKAAARTDLHGDSLPEGAVRRFGALRLRHGTGIRAMHFALGGKRLLSFGWDSDARIWDVETGKEV